MSRTWFAVVWVCALMVLCNAAWAKKEEGEAGKPDKAPKPAKVDKAAKEDKGPALRGYYAIIASRLQLTEAQSEQLAGIAEAKNKAAQEVAAAAESDPKAAKEKKAALEEEYDGKIRDILTPTQRASLEGLKMEMGIMRRYKKLGLSPEQEEQIKQLCAEAGKAVDSLDQRDNKSKAPIIAKLNQQITEQVLNAEQRAAAGADKPKADKPEKSDKAQN